MANWGNLLGRAVQVVMDVLTKQEQRQEPRRGSAPRPPRTQSPRARSAPAGDRARTIAYAPDLDGAADPGEIVWAWVPFEENDGRGKDRPLLVVGRGGGELLGLMLSSQHDRADDPEWMGIGAGAWDREGRASYVRLDRVIEVGEHDIRREGAVLDRERFERVADGLRSRHGWR
ncbi:type II toxin-antitoxin system PemK/MazF family toxin [Pseudonocardia sp.]|uniref:type II toxin-antitoxin system PemK/MazF family toxin n=1 Tax=Pseudonocardia sp. TaxID=60912 RepID=UPI003D10EAEC